MQVARLRPVPRSGIPYQYMISFEGSERKSAFASYEYEKTYTAILDSLFMCGSVSFRNH